MLYAWHHCKNHPLIVLSMVHNTKLLPKALAVKNCLISKPVYQILTDLSGLSLVSMSKHSLVPNVTHE